MLWIGVKKEKKCLLSNYYVIDSPLGQLQYSVRNSTKFQCCQGEIKEIAAWLHGKLLAIPPVGKLLNQEKPFS